MNRKNIIVLVGVFLVFAILGILFFSPSEISSNNLQNLNSNVTSSRGVLAPLEGDHVIEINNPKNVIIEYASLTCPHCAAFHNEVFPKIKAELINTGKVKYIFRDFPIDPYAMAGSMIAHCAGDEKYFAVINVLLKTQDQWLFDNENPYNGLLKVARLASLSEEEVEMCLKNKSLFSQIENNQKMATNRFGVNGTPAIFVNESRLTTLDFETILEFLGNN